MEAWNIKAYTSRFGLSLYHESPFSRSKVANLIPSFVKFSLVENESPRGSHVPLLTEDEFARIESIFDQQLQQIKQRAEHNLGQSIGISAISLPYYWNEQLKEAVQQAASHPHMMVRRDMLLCHELTARLAYNLGNSREGAWFFVSVEYNTLDLYLTFAMIIDPKHPGEDPRYSVDGQYLLENLGEASLTRADSHLEHDANIKEAINRFYLKHVSKDPYSKFPYSYIRGIILTGDASDNGMRTMKRILREVFVDLPQCASGNIFTSLRPSHVMALGAARAVRTQSLKENLSRDVCETVDIEDED